MINQETEDEIKTSLLKLDKEILVDLYLQKAFEKDIELKTLQNRVNEVNAIFESKMTTLARKNEQLHESLSNQCHIRAELEGKVFNLKQENRELKKRIKILEKK